MSLKDKFQAHPATVGETYGEHFVAAMGFSLTMLKGAFFCGIHALLPFCCEKTGSDYITRLHDRMVTNRSRAADAGQTPERQTARARA